MNTANTRELLIAVYRVHRVIQANRGVAIPKWSQLMEDDKRDMVKEYEADGSVPWPYMRRETFEAILSELN